MGRHLRQNELLKRPPMLSNHGLGGPVLRHGFDLIADISISAMLCESAHSLRLPTAVLRFGFRHW
jgi:hypothetical protein